MAKSRNTAKIIGRANRRFTRRLNQWNNYLADGDWRSSYHSMSYLDGDDIVNAGVDKTFRDARNYKLDFDVLINGQLSATRTFSKDGTTYSEEYIGMVDPWAKQFLMWSVDGTDQMLGTITPQEDAFTIRLSGPGHIWDRVCRGELCGCELNKRDVVRNRNPRNPKLAGGNAAYASLAGLQHTCRH